MDVIFPKNILQYIIKSLQANYSIQESGSLAYIIYRESIKTFQSQNFGEQKNIIFKKKEINEIIEKLLDNEPIQHILGYADFYGNQFLVNKDVLIPRQETEELVQLIINKNLDKNFKILDIGTGSGCISCTLALKMNKAKLYALDISSKALKIAKKNADSLGCNILFIQSNILTEELPVSNLDIIVSNPPYVTEKEKKLMHQNVLAFEPKLALFVPDKNPLLFYYIISQKSKKSLKNGGKLYFEINELFGAKIASLMEKDGFKNVEIYQDLNGKDRFISGII